MSVKKALKVFKIEDGEAVNADFDVEIIEKKRQRNA